VVRRPDRGHQPGPYGRRSARSPPNGGGQSRLNLTGTSATPSRPSRARLRRRKAGRPSPGRSTGRGRGLGRSPWPTGGLRCPIGRGRWRACIAHSSTPRCAWTETSGLRLLGCSSAVLLMAFARAAAASARWR